VKPIETSTRCSCGGYVCVRMTEGWADQAWGAECGSCYDPSEGSGDRAMLSGRGPTHEKALLAWEEAHEDMLGDEPLSLPDMFGDLARQVSEEAERTRGWRLKPDFDINHSRSEFIYGPEGA
jgi:hypothetical protein